MERVRHQQEAAIAAAGRIALALLASAAIHLIFATRLELAVTPASTPHSLQARLNLEPVPPVARTPALEKRAPVSVPTSVVAPPAHTPDAIAPAFVPPMPEPLSGDMASADTAAPAITQPETVIEVPVDPVYYAAREIDVYPLPVAPLTISWSGERGWVRLLTLIDETGTVATTEVFDAEPIGRFDEEAAAIIRSTRFSPARKDGVPVRSRVLIELQFGQ
jgi:protein TonB